MGNGIFDQPDSADREIGQPPTQSDAQLIEDFTRVVRGPGGLGLEVAVIDWHGHEPIANWKAFRRWKREPSDSQIANAQRRSLDDRRFFRVCELCAERNNVGHMADEARCQTCAEQAGVVF